MRYFDLHCDTLGLCVNKNKAFINNGFHVDLNKIDFIDTYIQCTAAFVSDDCLNKKQRCEDMLSKLANEITVKNKCDLENVNAKGGHCFIPTVENCGSLLGDIKNVDFYSSFGVKMATLTWNADNEIGGGVLGNSVGLTDFGEKIVDEFNRRKIIIDISHASEKLFFDVCDYTSRAFVASHSNAKHICENPRNLSDEQIRIIVKRNGLVGLNFYKAFLNRNSEKASIADIIKHAEYILALGGDDVLSMGSDFDGCDLPSDMIGIENVYDICNEFSRLNYSSDLIDKIFYRNAYDFFIRNW